MDKEYQEVSTEYKKLLEQYNVKIKNYDEKNSEEINKLHSLIMEKHQQLLNIMKNEEKD